MKTNTMFYIIMAWIIIFCGGIVTYHMIYTESAPPQKAFFMEIYPKGMRYIVGSQKYTRQELSDLYRGCFKYRNTLSPMAAKKCKLVSHTMDRVLEMEASENVTDFEKKLGI